MFFCLRIGPAVPPRVPAAERAVRQRRLPLSAARPIVLLLLRLRRGVRQPHVPLLERELGQGEGDEQHERQGLEAGAEQAGAAHGIVRAQVARGALGRLARGGRSGVVLLADALRPRSAALAPPPLPLGALLALLAPFGQQPDARLG